MKRFIVLFILLFYSIIVNSQERKTYITNIEIEICSELTIPDKSYWKNHGIITKDYQQNWRNEPGIIKKLYLGRINEYPDYCVLIVPNCAGVMKEHIYTKITDYDKVIIHAIPTTAIDGYTYFIFPITEILQISEYVRVYCDNGINKIIFNKSDSDQFYSTCLSPHSINKTKFIKILEFWKIYYSKLYQNKLEKERYVYGSIYHHGIEYTDNYFSIVKYKNVIRFNCNQLHNSMYVKTDVYLESSYFEIPFDSWTNFILKLNTE